MGYQQRLTASISPVRGGKLTILVTGTGGGAGQSVLKALQGSGYRVIAADGEILGAGLYAAEKGYVIPYAKSSEFVDRVKEICVREEVKLLIPGLDAELPILSRSAAEFAREGITVVVGEENFVSLCDDKLATSRFLEAQGFPYPATWTLDELPEDEMTFPLIIKPKIGGARSIGVRLIRNLPELKRLRQEIDGTAFVAQEFIDGPEYTCGSVTLEHRCVGVIAARRILRDGDTYKAFIERDSMIEGFVAEVVDRLQPFGPCNVQLRVRDKVPYIFELNARFSGTTYCRALAGFNEPKIIADYLLKDLSPCMKIRPITVLRYWKELVVENGEVEACGAHREICGQASPL